MTKSKQKLLSLLNCCVLPGDPDKEACTGLVFRVDSSEYVSGHDLCYKQRLRYLKNRSCKCPGCESILEQARENIGYFKEYFLPQVDLENGDFCTLQIKNISRDWETGVVDEWDLVVDKIED